MDAWIYCELCKFLQQLYVAVLCASVCSPVCQNLMNNCEDFALYCKTGLLVVDNQGVGRSGQASSVIGAPLAAMLSSPLKLLMPSPVGVATVTAGMYCMSRYATDIGVRSDVIKVGVEDLAVNLGWTPPQEELAEDETSDTQIITK
ncbi:hypothetical protein SESBI_19247 [Sesbania bispinosa]|nr:hypothetical protein SESBI_19247 [Sesbania bispinosa]